MTQNLAAEGSTRAHLRKADRKLQLLAFFIASLIALPIVAIAWIALTGSMEDLTHLVTSVVPRATGRTLVLMAGTAFITGITGIATAWLVVSCDFPGRKLLSVALVLPLAMPTYLAAYAFGEFFDFTGPLQTGLRAIFGWTSAKEYWFFDLRSTGGAIFVLGSVLYPYIYLTCRSMFLMQGRTAADVARTLGAGPLRVLFRVQIPMARPAIIVGLTLVMMETLNDIGAVEYLGVQTLTFSIYDTWLNRGSLSGAAQIAVILLLFVVVLTLIERLARRRQRFSNTRTTSAVANTVRIPLNGWRKWTAFAVCFLPMCCGFLIPSFVLGDYAIKRLDAFHSPRLLSAIANSLGVSFGAAVITVILAFTLSYAHRTSRSQLTIIAGRIVAFGYGIPGTVLAIGVLIPLSGLDNAVDGFMRAQFGYSTGLLLSGTVVAIIYACSVRFFAMCEGTLDAGFQKLSTNLDMASRTLGRTRAQTLRTVLLPMMRPATMTAALFVFIETMKELSATIMLRPFGFNSLATLVYEDASRSRVEDASVPALIIILAGLIPVILVSRSMERARTS
jgi:iron(III) transport system permease protein